MSLVSSVWASLGRRRTSMAPAGTVTGRNKAASIWLGEGMCWIHWPSSARPARTRANKESAIRLRLHFKGHLLAANVVGEILGGYGETVFAGSEVGRNEDLAGIGRLAGIPAQIDGRCAVHAGHDGARGFRGAD